MSTIGIRRPVVALLAVAAAAVLLIPLLGTSRAGAADSSVYVVHGIPGVAVDVYAGGTDASNEILPDFMYGDVAGPLTLPEGDLQVIVVVAGADPTVPANVVIDQTVAVPGGADVSVVADLVGGTPVLTPFVNDVSPVNEGEGRVTVRHAADAPAVQVLVNGEVAIPNLAAGDQASAVLPAGTYDIQVQLTDGTPLPALSPGDVDIPAGVNTIAYATGSATDQDFPLGLVLQAIDIEQTPGSTPETPAPAPAPAPAEGATTAPHFTG